MTHPLALARQYAEQEADTSTCRQLLRAALAEVDRLRRLPVLASCGDCRHFRDDTTDSCALEARDLPGDDVVPDWCPFRGKP